MSTRSNIRVLCADTVIREVYVHFDGYAHLETLKEHYNSQKAAESIIALGDLSSLENSTEKPEGHSFDHAVPGYSIAYHRDRGEAWEDVKPREFKNFGEAWEATGSDIEYVYEWDTLAWRKYEVDPSRTRADCYIEG